MVATAQHLALTERHIAKVLAGGAALDPTEADQLTVTNEWPVLHAGMMRSSAAVLLPRAEFWANPFGLHWLSTI